MLKTDGKDEAIANIEHSRKRIKDKELVQRGEMHNTNLFLDGSSDIGEQKVSFVLVILMEYLFFVIV